MAQRSNLNTTHGSLPYNGYASNLYSQNGEDGILAQVLDELGKNVSLSKWCVEFGAWDGVHLSNTFALVEQKGFSAVYIEGDQARFKALAETSRLHKTIHPINAFVSDIKQDPNSLEMLLATTPIPKDFDVLSIDIDSRDLDIWESFEAYAPKVVIIEINSTVPPGVVWRHGPASPGNTFTATLNVAKFKGYSAICHTGNLFLVRDDLLPHLSMDDRFLSYPELLFLFDSTWAPTRIFLPIWKRLFREAGLWLLSRIRPLLFWRR